jgi:hypothetical protein
VTINQSEIYESLRISTIFSGHTFVTSGLPKELSWNDEQDDAFFCAHPKRRFLLRISNSGEFDAPVHRAMLCNVPYFRHAPPISAALTAVYADIPPLWALVSRLHPKHHAVTAVYRGSAFFATAMHENRVIAKSEDDCHVSVLLAAMTMKQGIDGREWNAFAKKYAETVAAMTRPSPFNKVN